MQRRESPSCEQIAVILSAPTSRAVPLVLLAGRRSVPIAAPFIRRPDRCRVRDRGIRHHAAARWKHRLNEIAFCVSRLRRANSHEWNSAASSRYNSRPVAWAIASRVRSSAVGPSPPVATIRSARSTAWRNSFTLASSSSPTVVSYGTRIPNSPQSQAEPFAVGIQPLPGSKFVTNGNDFGNHRSQFSCCSGLLKPRSRKVQNGFVLFAFLLSLMSLSKPVPPAA